MAIKQAMGVYSKLCICPEKEFKVPPDSLEGKVYSMPFNSVGVAATQNTTDPATMTGRRDAVEPIMGNIDVQGDIVVPMDSRAFGYWLAAAFGSPTTAAGTKSGTYKHVFKAGKEQPSFIISKEFSNGVYVTSRGCKVSKLAFSFGGDGELTGTISVVGCNEELGNAPLVSAPTEIAMSRYNNFQADLKLDGKESQVVTEVSCDIDFGLDTEGYAIGGNGFRTRVNEGIIKPSGSLTAFFDDKSFLEKAMNSTKTALEINLTKGDTLLTIKLPEMKFPRNSPSIEGATGITQTLDWGAFYENNSENACVVIELTNEVESYEFTGTVATPPSGE